MRDHGYARYKLDHCRCYVCAAAASEYNTNRERAIAYGRWQPFVPADPVRVHIAVLRECGIGLRQLATLTGLSRSALTGITAGKPGRAPAARVRPATAERILAIEPTLDNIAAKTPVSSVGTLRRLHALIAAGWPQTRLGQRLGINPTNTSTLLKSANVTAGRARAVRALYDQLWDQEPSTATPQETAGVSRSRTRARTARWYPPAAWDDDLLDLSDADLAVELERRAQAMDDAEVQSCFNAYTKLRDRTPLTSAGAAEYRRRRVQTRAVSQ